MGRVVVRYDDVWSDVCFESKESGLAQRSFSNVQVLCRELGFPGAMFARSNVGQGAGIHQSTVSGYVCKIGMYVFIETKYHDNVLETFIYLV